MDLNMRRRSGRCFFKSNLHDFSFLVAKVHRDYLYRSGLRYEHGIYAEMTTLFWGVIERCRAVHDRTERRAIKPAPPRD
jgi:hypothetical protein